MRSGLYFFIGVILITRVNAQHSTSSLSLEKEFKNPPIASRPKALWPWTNGNVSLSQITYELEESKRKGMGGFDIWDIGGRVDPNQVIPAGPAFLSEESVQAIAHTIREADRLGLEIGLTLSSSWNAGGSWVKPEHGAMGLFKRDTVVTGPITFSAVIPFPKIPDSYHGHRLERQKDPKTGLPVFYREVALLAHPVQNDSIVGTSDKLVKLPAGKNKNGKITWKVPAGKWRIVRYVCAPTGQPLVLPSPNSTGLMLDHFSADAQRYNLNYIFSKLIPVTGPLKGRSLKYLFADSYEVNSAVWTPALPEAFQKQNGYSLEQYLPVLDGFHVVSKEISKRFLFDFRKTLSDLIIRNHYQLAKEICEQNGIGFCAEAGGPGKPIHNVPFEDLKALGALTIPRGEFWNKHPQLDKLQVVKGIASASHIYNQKFVEAESFTSVWLWQEGPDELKPLADRAMCEGLNRFVYHTFPHTPPESGDPGWIYNFGTLINTTNGWWPKSNGFHEYLARCSYLLQQGNFVGDVAFYYGDDAPNFVPPKHLPASLGPGYDYDVVNTEILLEKMEVKNGRIYLPHGQYYEVLVLPHKIEINPKVLQKLEQLAATGATIIGPKPQTSVGLANHSANEKLVSELSAKLWGPCDSVNVKEHAYGKGKIIWGVSIREALNKKGVYPDVQTAGNENTALDFIHRSTGKEEIYFIRNAEKKTFSSLVQFRVKNLVPEFWKPETGEIIPVPFFNTTENGIALPISLRKNESCFIVFRTMPEKNQGQNVALNGKNLSIENPLSAEILYSSTGLLTTTSGSTWKWQSGEQTSTSTVNLPESFVLPGPWELRFEQSKGAPAREVFQQLQPLNTSTRDEIKYYSGNIEYHHQFTLTKDQVKSDQRILLDLGEVKEIAEVFINGHNVGQYWHSPYVIDITENVQPGSNNLIVEVVNTPNNRLVGDAQLPAEYQRTKSNVIRLPNAWMKPFAEAPLLKAGLIGPVQIRFAQVLK